MNKIVQPAALNIEKQNQIETFYIMPIAKPKDPLIYSKKIPGEVILNAKY